MEPLCIWPIVLDQIYHLPLTFWRDIVHPLLEDIGMGLNMSFDIFKGGPGGFTPPQERKSFKWIRPEQSFQGKEIQENTTPKREGICYRCGSKGHWSRVCRTPPHLCKLYKESLKGKGKEVNLNENLEGTTYLDSSDFANELD